MTIVVLVIIASVFLVYRVFLSNYITDEGIIMRNWVTYNVAGIGLLTILFFIFVLGLFTRRERRFMSKEKSNESAKNSSVIIPIRTPNALWALVIVRNFTFMFAGLWLLYFFLGHMRTDLGLAMAYALFFFILIGLPMLTIYTMVYLTKTSV